MLYSIDQSGMHELKISSLVLNSFENFLVISIKFELVFLIILVV